ncbi:MAG: hypothetical protein DMF68_01610 [Acidobacteria bacterium]|nr:MAG: hypothetical protein DMF68_01610 [Acidobacteriota bacterium]
MSERTPEVGKTIVFHDAKGQPHDALVTAVWSPTCINIVFVSQDALRQDSFGRQIERQTSLLHKGSTPVHGMYWRFSDEEPNPYVPPQAS